MTVADTDCCRIVEGSLTGSRAVDEQTFVSLEILSERLERVHKEHSSFSEVDFSPAAKELMSHKAVAV